MKKQSRKMISMALAAALALTSMPVSAFAEENLKTSDITTSVEKVATTEEAAAIEEVTDEEATETVIDSKNALVEAIKKAREGETITITDSFEIDSPIEINKAITVTAKDGVVLTASTSGSYNHAGDNHLFYLSNGAKLSGITANCGEYKGALNIAYMKSNTVVEGCDFTGSGATDSPVTRGIMIESGATDITISGNTFSNFFASAYINPSSGTITGNETKDTLECWCITDESEINFTKNTFSGENGVEMKIFANSGTPVTDHYYDLVKISAENNGVRIQDEVNKVTAEDGVWIVEADNEFADIQATIKQAKSGETIKLLSDITVENWEQIWNKDGITLDGNGKKLTIGSVSSGSNGNYLLYNASNLNVKNMTITFSTNGSAFSMTDGTIENVTFDGGTYGIVCGATDKGIIVKGCTFNNNKDWAIYSEESGNGKGNEITGCTFNSEGAVILRADEIFSNNIINGKSGITLAPTATSVVTENEFAADSYISLYDNNSTITQNKILGKVYINASVTAENNINLNYNYWGDRTPAEAIEGNETANVTVDHAYDTPDMDTMGVTTAKELQEAINAAGTTATTITLANDIILDTSIMVHSGSNITIEGGNNAIKLNYNASTCPAAFGNNSTAMPSDVTLTVKDTVIENIGKNVVSQGYGVLTAINATNTNISMDNCTFKNLYCGVYINPIKTADNKGTLSIKNCKYEDTTYGYSVDELTIGSYLNSVDVTYTGSNAPAEKEIWKNVAYVNGVAVANGETALQTAVAEANAVEGDVVITLAPGYYGNSNILLGDNNLTIKAQYPAYQNGNVTDEDMLTKFNGTLNTYISYDVFNEEQKVVIDGIAFAGDGLKIGNMNYNSVGNIEVRNCTMTTGNNFENANENNHAGYNYFVKTNGGDTQGYASVVVENNYVSGKNAVVTPLQLWKVDNVVVKDNVFELNDKVGAINVSKMNTDSKVEVSGNEVSGAKSGVSVTTWLLGGDTTNGKAVFGGSVTVTDNKLNVTGTPIFLGYDESAKPSDGRNAYGQMGGTVVATDNTNNGVAVGAEIGQYPEVTESSSYTVVIKDGEKIVATYMVDKDGSGEFKLPDKLSKTGYRFMGWSDKDGTIYDENSKVTVTEDAEFTAVWVKNSSPESDDSSSSSSSSSSSGTTEDIEDEDTPLTGEVEELPFTDVNEEAWYKEAVKYVYENEMMSGITSTTFGPNVTTTRGMIVTILYRLEGEPAVEELAKFDDVTSDAYYAKAVAWASANGVVSGYNETTFGPNDTITREQFASILYRYAQLKGYEVTEKGDITVFTDATKVSAWAKEAVEWAVGSKLITGKGAGMLDPTGTATRAEAAQMLMNFCENK